MAITAIVLGLSAATGSHAQPVDVLPVRLSEGAQSLNGTWAFKYIPSSNIGDDEKFHEYSFNTTTAPAATTANTTTTALAWKTIPVPSHWELHGFAEPQYNDDVKEGTGLYRRSFTITQDWQQQDKHVFLRFDGVLFGYTAWVNGKQVGEWHSSFNQVTFDITAALNPPGSENTLAVRVTTRSKGWSFDTMDCWALSGIYRDVTLFALPQAHLKDYTATTTLKPAGKAELRLDVLTSAAPNTIVAARLIAPDGKTTVAQTTIPLSEKNTGSTTFTIDNPKLWTAETPILYRLELDVAATGKIVQHYTDRIGLRQITIEDGILKLNGTPIKLRGIDHHEIWPDGRISTDENTRRDLELMRAANINFIRTSHYPPHPRLLEMCDEMGFYVDDEVPYVHGRKNLTDPDYQDTLYMRARATIMRDKNRPCVILWTLGNENPITDLGLHTGKYAKQLDPTRPIAFPTMGKYFDENWQKFPEYVDIYAPHYPSLKVATRCAEELKRPLIFTEYAHQRGLARGGTSVQDLWEIFYHSPRIAGGAVWMFQDQGIARTAKNMNSVKNADLMVWLDEQHYYDTNGYYAVDGIVYSDRTPQVDYWQVRKVYSPIQISEQQFSINNSGKQTFKLHVENRYDFRSLTGMKLAWTLLRNGNSVKSGATLLAAKPKETETVSINAQLSEIRATDVFILSIQCTDETNTPVYERAIRIDAGATANARQTALVASLPKTKTTLETTNTHINVCTPDYQLALDRRSGQLSLLDAKGETIISSFGPHTGHNPTINDMGKTRDREPMLWKGGILSEAIELKTSAQETANGIEITIAGNYPRPDVPTESVRGEYKLLVTPTGAIKVSYDFMPEKATGEFLEAGFALSLPRNHAEFRWLGKGPFAGYPGKDKLNEYGTFHLNRDDLYFSGNRREVEFASLARPDGTGILICGTDMTVDLEKIGGATILSHLSAVPGVENSKENAKENVDVTARLKASSVKHIAGRFTLFPLGAQWNALLTDWLGKPSDHATITKAYYHSYDQ